MLNPACPSPPGLPQLYGNRGPQGRQDWEGCSQDSAGHSRGSDRKIVPVIGGGAIGKGWDAEGMGSEMEILLEWGPQKRGAGI